MKLLNGKIFFKFYGLLTILELLVPSKVSTVLIGGRIVSELINAPANRELRQLLVLLGRIYVRHIKMELAAEACNFNIHTSSRPSNYGLFMALSLSLCAEPSWVAM